MLQQPEMERERAKKRTGGGGGRGGGWADIPARKLKLLAGKRCWLLGEASFFLFRLSVSFTHNFCSFVAFLKGLMMSNGKWQSRTISVRRWRYCKLAK